MVKVILERDKCIGCGSCQAVCPKYWEMADDGKINLLNAKKPTVPTQQGESENYELELEDVECNQEAADSCPVQCIHIKK